MSVFGYGLKIAYGPTFKSISISYPHRASSIFTTIVYRKPPIALQVSPLVPMFCRKMAFLTNCQLALRTSYIDTFVLYARRTSCIFDPILTIRPQLQYVTISVPSISKVPPPLYPISPVDVLDRRHASSPWVSPVYQVCFTTSQSEPALVLVNASGLIE